MLRQPASIIPHALPSQTVRLIVLTCPPSFRRALLESSQPPALPMSSRTTPAPAQPRPNNGRQERTDSPPASALSAAWAASSRSIINAAIFCLVVDPPVGLAIRLAKGFRNQAQHVASGVSLMLNGFVGRRLFSFSTPFIIQGAARDGERRRRL